MQIDLTPQQQAVLELLKRRGQYGVHVSEFTNDKRFGGLGIKGYTERISELRKKGYNVVNIRKNWYSLSESPLPQEKRPIEKPKTVTFSSNLPAAPAKLEGEELNAWQQMGDWLKGRGDKPQLFGEVVRDALY